MTESSSTAESKPAVPVHQWTHYGTKVLIVKCVSKGGVSHDGFVWPREIGSKVRCPKAAADRLKASTVLNTQEDCATGGLFGWPWAIGFGEGKEPDYSGDWIVFACDPADVIGLGDKAKCVGEVEIVYYGDALGAIMSTHSGRMAWIQGNAFGNAAASGESGNAAASGARGNAAASGERGNAAASGVSGNAAASGWGGNAAASGASGNAAASGASGNAAASGWSGNAAASGESGNAAASGARGNAAASGVSGNAAASDWGGNAAASGWSGNAAASDWGGNAAASGARGNAAASGERGNAAASGERGNAAASGASGNAAASGVRGIACLSGEEGSLEVGPHSLGAVTAECWIWKVHTGAVVCCRWKDNGEWRQRLLVADELHLAEGTVVRIEKGKIQEV